MMDTPPVSDVEFKFFHSIDRKLYTLLTVTLWRDPVESMQIMALWLWLERTNFNDVVNKILSWPYILINELADEAVTCLNCINHDHFACSSENYDIPLTQSVMGKEISLRFFHENWLEATQGVAKVSNEVCFRALNDIMQKAVDRNAAQSIANSQKMMAQPFQQSAVHPGSSQMGSGPSNVLESRISSQMGFGPSNVLESRISSQMGFGPSNVLESRTSSQMGFGPSDVLESRTRENEVPPDDRTMFVTFSKGYPVQEREVREFFTRAYGDCIETLILQDVRASKQSLFAKIVFHSTSTIDGILNGAGKVKFSINGKHVWARKYVPKRPKSLVMPPLPPV